MPNCYFYFVYILQSAATGRYYIGQTNDVEERLERHNAGLTRSGKRDGPWVLVYREEFERRGEAMRRERAMKSWKSRRAIEKLIGRSGQPEGSLRKH